MVPRIGEAHPALLTTRHRWARPDSFQIGAPATVVFRAAASRTGAQLTVRGIDGGDLIFFRLGARFGRCYNPSFLCKPGRTGQLRPLLW